MQRLDRAGIEVLLETEQFKSWFAELNGLNHRLELLESSIERAAEACAEAGFRCTYSVSYTHLTLPTILLV